MPSDSVRILMKRGVHLPHPDSVSIDDDVSIDRIACGSTIHAGCRLRGTRTALGRDSEIGREAPVTLENAVLGPKVQVAGGYLREAVLLDGASLGSGAQVREGTLLEEEASGAHTVGFKQTILMPFVTTGSLINFCDVFMAGGTSRQDHSEVGSSYIHFNFTPWGKKGDKATASLLGDVPRGVFLDQPRIFLGGQGGLVGPRAIGFGSVLAAGFVYRRNYAGGQLIVGETITPQIREFDPYAIGSLQKKLAANLRYVGNLVALDHWYREARLRWAEGDAEHGMLYDEALLALASGKTARLKALTGLASNLEPLLARSRHPEHALVEKLVDQSRNLGPAIEGATLGDPVLHASFRELLAVRLSDRRESFVSWVQSWDESDKSVGRRWLDSIVAGVQAIGDDLFGG